MNTATNTQFIGPEPPEKFTPANDQSQYRYLIEFAQPGLLDTVHVRGSNQPFDANSPEAVAARAALQAYQAERVQAIDTALGRSLEVSHHFLVTHNGLALWLDPQEVEAVARLPEVVSITREPQYELATYRGPWFIGADTLWNGTNTPDSSALRGEGMVIGVIDTGIDPEHPSFGNDPACNHGQGAIPGKVLSALDCGSTDEDGLCNGANPVDTHGHGTHVASTAAGNFLNQNALPPPQPPGTATEISGVAPCAHIRAYLACPGGSCPFADIQAGMNSILLHGDVDVMNFSISGGTEPWNDNDRRKLDLVDAGVFVAAAAGNTGGNPNPTGRVNHRGPWVLSVAANSHDGATDSALLSASGPGEPPDETRDIVANQGTDSPAAPGFMDLPIRHFDQQPVDFEGCTPGVDDGTGNTPPSDMAPFPEDFFAGAAALIRRGSCFFTTKITNAFDAGAELVIIRNNEPGEWLIGTTDQPDVPAYSIQQAPGNALQAFVSDHPDSATIDFEPIAGDGDVLADFSLRGPTPPPLHNLTKPDITAPGVSIYAAVPQDVVPEGYGILSGTSMASPHAAGSALLLRQAHPEWTVPEVMSALMTTAEQAGRKENLVDAWDPDDVGSGRVDLTKAALAGLVMDETFQNYLDADPDTGGDVRTLNTPSLRDMNCRGSCTWTRTVRNTLGVPSQWTAVGAALAANSQDDATIFAAEAAPTGSTNGTPPFQITTQPETFTFTGDPGETQELTITVHPLENNLAAPLNFGELVFTETGAQAPDQHLTVAVRGRPPQPMIAHDPRNHGTTLQEDETETWTLTISNPGEEPLAWAVTENPVGGPSGPIIAPEGAPTGSGIDCNNQPGLIINDDGSSENGYSDDPSVVSQVAFVDKFTPDTHPFHVESIAAVCLSFLTQGPTSLDLEVVIFNDDGPGGSPGTELGTLPVTADALATNVGVPVWNAFDISPLDITVAFDSSVYIGARWAPLSPQNVFIGADLSGPNPPGFADGYRWNDDEDEWMPIILGNLGATYRALFIRAVAELGDLECALPGWVSIDTPNGIVDPDGSQQVAVTFDPTGLEPGVHTASLCMETNDPDQPLAVVLLALTLPELPEDLIFRDRFQ